jgi:hypothetical protein
MFLLKIYSQHNNFSSNNQKYKLFSPFRGKCQQGKDLRGDDDKGGPGDCPTEWSGGEYPRHEGEVVEHDLRSPFYNPLKFMLLNILFCKP